MSSRYPFRPELYGESASISGTHREQAVFSDTTFTAQLGDLEAAAAHARSLVGEVDLLIGHSLGGTAEKAGTLPASAKSMGRSAHRSMSS